MAHQAAEHQGMLPITGKGLILILGGLFLIWKATKEIHHKVDDNGRAQSRRQDHEFHRGARSTSP